jgi:hypothetical protein
MSIDYRFVVAGCRTGTVKSELTAVSGMNLNLMLNRPGALTLSVPKSEPGLTLNGATIVYPGTHAIYVERNGEILFGGPIEQIDASGSKNDLKIVVNGWWDYFRNRFLNTRMVFSNRDVYDIIRNVWPRVAASNVFGNDSSFLTFRWPTTNQLRGVQRTITYESWELHSFASIVEQWAADSETEFDIEMRSSWVSEQKIGHTLAFYHPELGELSKHKLTFHRDPVQGSSAPGTISDYKLAIMGSQLANFLFGIGRGDSYLKKISRQRAEYMIHEYWREVVANNGGSSGAGGALPIPSGLRIDPREILYREGMYSRTDIGVQTHLDKVTKARLRATQLPPLALGIDVERGTYEEDNSLMRPGNTVSVLIDDGYTQVDEVHRIVVSNITLGDDMSESLKVQTVRPALAEGT